LYRNFKYQITGKALTLQDSRIENTVRDCRATGVLSCQFLQITDTGIGLHLAELREFARYDLAILRIVRIYAELVAVLIDNLYLVVGVPGAIGRIELITRVKSLLEPIR